MFLRPRDRPNYTTKECPGKRAKAVSRVRGLKRVNNTEKKFSEGRETASDGRSCQAEETVFRRRANPPDQGKTSQIPSFSAHTLRSAADVHSSFAPACIADVMPPPLSLSFFVSLASPPPSPLRRRREKSTMITTQTSFLPSFLRASSLPLRAFQVSTPSVFPPPLFVFHSHLLFMRATVGSPLDGVNEPLDSTSAREAVE